MASDDLVGRTGFEPGTSSVSVPGQPEFRGRHLAMIGGDGMPSGLVV